MVNRRKMWRANLTVTIFQAVFAAGAYVVTDGDVLAVFAAFVAAAFGLFVSDEVGFRISGEVADATAVALVASVALFGMAYYWQGADLLSAVMLIGTIFITGLAAFVLLFEGERSPQRFVLLLPFGIGLVGGLFGIFPSFRNPWARVS